MIENIDKEIINNIDKHGHSILHFPAEEEFPSYSHTIGLFEHYDHPELVIFGLDEETHHILISDACDRIKDGQAIVPDVLHNDFFKGYHVMFIHANLDEYKGFFGFALDFYEGNEFPIYQLVWPDEAHKFPWDNKFNPALKSRQPVLT